MGAQRLGTPYGPLPGRSPPCWFGTGFALGWTKGLAWQYLTSPPEAATKGLAPTATSKASSPSPEAAGCAAETLFGRVPRRSPARRVPPQSLPRGERQERERGEQKRAAKGR